MPPYGTIPSNEEPKILTEVTSCIKINDYLEIGGETS
jgi:hypothetical protein